MNIYNLIKEEYDKILKENNNIDKAIDIILKKGEMLKLPSFINGFNQKMRREGIIKMYKIDYDNDLSRINGAVASRFLNELSNKIGNGFEEVDFRNQSKKPDDLFQMALYGIVALFSDPFICVDDKHNVVPERTKIEICDLRDGDNYLNTLLIIK